MNKVLALVLVMFCFSPLTANAASVDVPMVAKGMEGSIFRESTKTSGVSVAVDMDSVANRDLDKFSGEIEGNFYQAKCIFSFDNKMDFYCMLGQGQDISCDVWLTSSDVRFDLENETVWGGGFNGVFFESYRYGLQVFTDFKYRRSRNIKYQSVTVDGVRFNPGELTDPTVNAGWDEWQIALGVVKDFEYIKPYIGIKYSDVDFSASATAAGTSYELGGAGSNELFGVFVGCSIVPTKQFSVDVGGRFIDEEGLTVSAAYKF